MAGKIVWTDEMIQGIEARLHAGETLDEIAKAFDRSRTTIKAVIASRKIARPLKHRWTDADVDYLHASREAGVAFPDIAAHVGVSEGAARRKWEETRNRRPHVEWTDDRLDRLRSLAEHGATRSEAAAEFYSTYDAIKAAAAAHGIQFQSQTRAKKLGPERHARVLCEFPDWVRFEDDPEAIDADRVGRAPSRPVRAWGDSSASLSVGGA